MDNINENVAQFIITSSTLFAEMPAHYANKLYFLEDTGEIYRGNQLFTSSVVFFTGDFPSEKATNKIYINSETFDGYCWDGAAWIKVITKYIVVNDITSLTPNDNIPSVSALRKIFSKSITDIHYDDKIKGIKFIQNEVEYDVPITALVTNGEFESGTDRLIFRNLNGEEAFNIQMKKDNYPVGGYYDNITKSVILQMRTTDEEGNPTEVVIPAADLVDIKISQVEGNILQEYDDGYGVVVDLSSKVDKVEKGRDGRIMTAKEDGNANAINMFVGGVSLSLTDLGDGRKQASPNLLATEAAVYEFVKTLSEDIENILGYVLVQEINRDNPKAINYPSEPAVAAMWNTIDDQINKLSDSIKSIGGDSGQATENITAINKELVTIKQNISELKNITDTIPTIQNQVDTLSTETENLKTSVETNSGNIHDLSTSIDTINNRIATITTSLSDLSSKHSEDISTINQSITELSNAISSVNTQINNLIASTETTNKNFSDRILALEGAVQKAKQIEIQMYI